jgi:type VI secretion system protein
MRLILNVTSNKRSISDSVNRVIFDHHGGGIGRAQDNACVLPDPERFISSQHAVIEFHDDAYLLTDTSVNGVYLNNSDQSVGNDNSVRLSDGDCLTMGDYELRVTIEPETAAESDEMKPSVSPWGIPNTRGNAPNIFDGNEQQAVKGGFSDGDKEESFTPPSRRPATEPDHSPVEQSHFSPPLMREEGKSPDWDRTDYTPQPNPEEISPPSGDHVPPGSGAEIEESGTPDWDRTYFTPAPIPQESSSPEYDGGEAARNQAPSARVDNPEAGPDSRRSSEDGQNFERVPISTDLDATGDASASTRDSSTMQSTGEDAIQAFFHAAGMNEEQLPPEAAMALMKLLGSLYREIVQDLMVVLRARSDLKNEFRMRHTQISTKENNPLKFSGTVDEALEHLVFNQAAGFLPPEAAFQEAFEDIKDHQIAMVVGMRAAFESLLRRFDPEQLEQRVIKGKKIGNLLPVNRKANCWDRYEEWYAEISAAADDDFQGVFGDEFTRAYEEQVARLALLRKKSGRE